MRLDQLFDVRQSQSRIQNVLDQDDVLAFHGVVNVLHQFHFPAVLPPCAIAGNSNEVKADVQLDLARQVGKEDGCTFQYANENNGLSGKIVGNLLADLRNFGGDLVVWVSGREDIPWKPG